MTAVEISETVARLSRLSGWSLPTWGGINHIERLYTDLAGADIVERGTVVGTFFTSFVLFGGVLLVASIPVFVVAWRQGRMTTIRNFLIAAGVVAALCAAVSLSIDKLAGQCLGTGARGYDRCLDVGGVGAQLLIVGGYVVTALSRASYLRNEGFTVSRRTGDSTASEGQRTRERR